jgi:hypothetical protein
MLLNLRNLAIAIRLFYDLVALAALLPIEHVYGQTVAPIDSVAMNVVSKTEPAAPAKPEVLSFDLDSTFQLCPQYDSFGNILEWLPGVYFFDRASVGQPAVVSLFAGPVTGNDILYDGMILNDPVDGSVDLNLIPVQGMANATLVLFPTGENGFLTPGDAITLRSRNIAGAPIRSQVSYRTGANGLDDIDLRLGAKASPVLSINAGWILRNYAGTTVHSTYRGQKANLKFDRRVGEKWLVSYSLLMNELDRDLPEPFMAPSLDYFLNPHQKDQRFDHDLLIKDGDAFYTHLQLTDLHREMYSDRRAVLGQVHDDSRIMGRSGIGYRFLGFDATTGFFWSHNGLKSAAWGNHDEWQVDLWSRLARRFKQKWQVQLGLQAEKTGGFDLAIEPDISLALDASADFKVFAWAAHRVSAPDFSTRFSNGPFVYGNDALSPERLTTAGLGIRKTTTKIDLHATATFSRHSNEIAVPYDAEKAENPGFQNVPQHSTVMFDHRLFIFVNEWLGLAFKGHLYADRMSESGLKPLNLPSLHEKAFLQIGKTLFQGDLKPTLRLGGAFYGRRYGSDVYYAAFAKNAASSGPVLLPYIVGLFHFKDAAIFIVYDNPLSQDAEIVYGYPKERAHIRWGFTWHFLD